MIGFGEFKKRKIEEPIENGVIKSLDDNRLLKIKITEDFYDRILNCSLENNEQIEFMEAIEEIKESRIGNFWVPIYTPSLIGEDIVFLPGKKPAIEKSFNWWKEKVGEMPMIEQKKWKLGNAYQYYSFLVYIFNRLITIGWSQQKALEAIIYDSRELGHYLTSKNAKKDLESTGSREVAGVYDLANTMKILYKSEDNYWQAGGAYNSDSKVYPLADLYLNHDVNFDNVNGVGWIILE